MFRVLRGCFKVNLQHQNVYRAQHRSWADHHNACTVGLLAHERFGPDDATEAAWCVVDIVTMLAMIRLVKVAKD